MPSAALPSGFIVGEFFAQVTTGKSSNFFVAIELNAGAAFLEFKNG